MQVAWIPVNEMEPQINCLIIDDLGQIEIARRITKITLPSKEVLYLANDRPESILSFLNDEDTLICCTHITHWMPLPPPPLRSKIK